MKCQPPPPVLLVRVSGGSRSALMRFVMPSSPSTSRTQIPLMLPVTMPTLLSGRFVNQPRISCSVARRSLNSSQLIRGCLPARSQSGLPQVHAPSTIGSVAARLIVVLTAPSLGEGLTAVLNPGVDLLGNEPHLSADAYAR